MRVSRSLICGGVILALCSQEVFASSIQDVRILPTCAINPQDRVMLEVFVLSPTSPNYLYKPTHISAFENHIDIDLFVTGGTLDALSSRMFAVDLGSYPAGEYSFTIRVHDSWWPEITEYNGDFEVTRKHCDGSSHVPRLLYWADFRGMIRQCSLDGLKMEGLIDNVNPLALAVDAARREIYWASVDLPINEASQAILSKSNLDGSTRRNLAAMDWEVWPRELVKSEHHLYWIGGWNSWDSIWRSDLDGSNLLEILNGLSNPMNLMVDGQREKIYWNERGQIKHANIDGSGSEALLDGRLLALDARADRIIWSTWTHGSFVQGLYRSSLDGTDATLLVKGDSVNPTSLLWAASGKMYWVNRYEEVSIFRANMDGSDVEEIVRGLDFPPEELVYDSRHGKLLWVVPSEVLNRSAGILMSANVDGTEVAAIADGVGWAFGLAADRTYPKIRVHPNANP